jgi:hypothetical protein
VTTIVRGIPDPVASERVLDVHPALAPYVEAAWRKRTNFFPGRSVNDLALTAEQAERGGRLASGAQGLAPGVVVGLEASLEGAGELLTLHVAPGLGLSITGEDARLTRPLEVRALDLVVDDEATLRDVLADAGTEARAFVVQLRPITVDQVGEHDPDDPCEIDPTELAFQDELTVDGCRVRLRALAVPLPAAGPRFRNELAHAVLAAEAALPPGQVPAWAPGGVPIALLAFPGGGAAPILDLHAVARDGGGALGPRPLREATDLVVSGAGWGAERLWQARFQQFLAELREADFEALRTAGLAARFRYLPPVGMLPTDAIDVRGDRGEPDLPLPAPPILPASFVIEAVPVELESLDDFLRAGAFQAPIDLGAAEQVQILVPVPQQHFDPDLLLVEDETPDEFRVVIQHFLLRLNHRRGRRFWVRLHDRVLADFVSNEGRDYPPEPDAIDGELSYAFPTDADLPSWEEVPPPEQMYAHTLPDELRALGVKMDESVGAGPPERRLLAVLLFHIANDHGFVGPDRPDISSFNITRDELVKRFMLTRFGGRGLAGFVESLGRRLINAAEKLDLSFARLESELFRLRAFMAGEEAATQMATSPALAAVSTRSLARPTPIRLEQFRRNVFLDVGRRQVTPAATEVHIPSSSVPTGDREVATAVVFGKNIFQRLTSSVATDAKESARRTRIAAYRTLIALHDSGLALDGLLFPGFMETLPVPGQPLPRDRTETIDRIRGFVQSFEIDGTWIHDPPEPSSDEAGFFAGAVRSLEQTIAGIRLAEARLTAFEAVMTIARDKLGEVTATWDQVRRRLAELEDDIAEIRQDIRVARVLEREESARARATNAQRRQVIAEHVPFLLLRRPRTTDGMLPVPSYAAQPAVRPDAVPASLAADFEAPEQLRAMVDLLKDARIEWVKAARELVRGINRWAALQQLVEVAAHRARFPEPLGYAPFEGAAFTDRTGLRLRALFVEQRRVADAVRQRAGTLLDARSHRQLSWNQLLVLAEQLATVNDLLLARHGRQDVANKMADELTNVYRVSASLFEHFRRVPPIIRLAWVEALSENDAQVDLRNLSVLPSWGQVHRVARGEMQSLVDWLYGRVDERHLDALSFMNDLVRVTLLLSSHAPVNRILGAQVLEPRPVSQGGRINLRLDPLTVRVGMHVLLYDALERGRVVARGVIEDLGEGVAAVQVVSTEQRQAVTPLRAEVAEPARTPRVRLHDGNEVSVGFAVTPR